MDEVWKDIDGFPGYQVSNLGKVQNKKTGHVLKQVVGRDGRYLSVYLTNGETENTQRVHRLVAKAFLGDHPNLVVNHKDGNRRNNNLNNLEWCTAGENNRHAIKTGLNYPGAYQKKPVRILETGEIFDGITECADATGCDFRNIHSALNYSGRHSVNGLHFEYVGDNEFNKKPKRSEQFLYDYQMDAVNRMKNGCILNGGVGSGKSRTGLYYYFSQYGGSINPDYVPMKNPADLYIITTAMKRDSKEWLGELSHYLLCPNPELNYYKNNIVVDSWNNIKKYQNVYGAFFIFDEDRVCGKGAWVKAFLKIAKRNKWIILSATSGDKWEDYIPVFVANGFYKNRTEFKDRHVIERWVNKSFPQVVGYINEGRLQRLRAEILVDMDFNRQTVAHHEDVYVRYCISKYKDAGKTRWNPYKDQPMVNAAELCYTWRRIVNEDESRQVAILELYEKHPKMIIFYNFDYELDILKQLFTSAGVEVAEWNGHKHQPVPNGKRWVYLVQYTAGAEGWNCITTDTIVFYSQNYSYKVMQQAAGRIDRLNTPFKDLYYYHLKTRSGIDLAISRALNQKKKFNESGFISW